MHPATIPLRFVKDAPSTLLGLPAALAFISDVGWETVFKFAAVAAFATLAFVYLGWRSFKYGVGRNEVVIERGLLSRTRRSIPFDRIQDVDTERGPLHRLFGLAKVRIETGAGGTDEGVLDSVTLEEAGRIRSAVRAVRLEDTQSAAPSPWGPSPPRELPPERTIFQMSVPRVLLSGLYNFSMVYLAGLFAVLQTFEGLLPFDIYDPGRWLGLVDEELTQRFTVEAALAVLLLAVLIGIVFGIVRTLARDYGFRLTVEGERFKRERGLFTRTEIVMPKRRVQIARLQTGPFRRRFGWFELFFQTLSQGQDGGGHQSVAPLAKTAEVEAILAEQQELHLPGAGGLQRVSSRHVVRTIAQNTIVPIAIFTVAAIALPIAAFSFMLLPPLIGLALLERRYHRYALAGPILFIQRGIWRQQLWIVPVAKVQTVKLTRGLLQRQLGVATLAVDTAGGPFLGGPRIVDLRETTARALADELTRRMSAAQPSVGRNSGTDR